MLFDIDCELSTGERVLIRGIEELALKDDELVSSPESSLPKVLFTFDPTLPMWVPSVDAEQLQPELKNLLREDDVTLVGMKILVHFSDVTTEDTDSKLGV